MTYKENITAILECCFAGFKEEIIEAACNRILGLKPKTGHWIRVDKTKVKCSECEITHMIAQYPNGKIDWCPNCGAIMGTDKKDWLNKDVTDWEEFETNVCYASVGYNAEISFVEKCIGRKLTYIEKYLLLKAINTKP